MTELPDIRLRGASWLTAFPSIGKAEWAARELSDHGTLDAAEVDLL